MLEELEVVLVSEMAMPEQGMEEEVKRPLGELPVIIEGCIDLL